MRAPKDQGGQDPYTGGVYKKIVPKERLEFSQSLTDKDGNKIDPAQAGMPPNFPKEMHTSVVLNDKGDLTELTIAEYDWTVGQMFVYSLADLHQSIDKLAESQAGA